MKLRMLAVILVVVLILPVAVQAAEPRMITCAPGISFNGTTATCSVRIVADVMSDEIEAIITLWHGTTKVDSWTASSNGYLFFSDTATVAYGQTYKLTVEYWVNDVQRTTAYTTRTCPNP